MAARPLRWALVVAAAVILVVAGAVGYQLLASRGTFARSLPPSQAGGEAVQVEVAGHRTAGRAYLSGTPDPSAPLVVVLHGDAPFVNPRYQYLFAHDVAQAASGVRAVALLRPGYSDPYGARSDGDRGFATGDTYTPDVVRTLGAAIEALKARWKAPSAILVGHSGGATLAADVAALNPGLVQQVFLIGCPCDVPAFRLHMAHLQTGPLWLLPTHALSPLATLEQMRPGTSITAISGAEDPIALPQYARAYVARAQARGLPASMVVLPTEGHEILNDQAVVERVADAARAIG